MPEVLEKFFFILNLNPGYSKIFNWSHHDYVNLWKPKQDLGFTLFQVGSFLIGLFFLEDSLVCIQFKTIL